MKKVVLTVLKIAGIVLLVLILLIAGFLFWLSRRPFVPNDYTETVETGGALEAKYLAMGPYEVKQAKAEAPEDWKEFVAYYPAQLEDSGDQWPAVVFVNGTGVYAAKYPALFRHLASWGFIVLGNEDPGTFSGDSTDATLAWLLEQNGDPDSVFYQKVDTAHMGLSGHSQGGVGVFNAISEQPNGGLYTCAVSLSPTQEDLAAALNIPYDPSKTVIPTLVLAGTSNDVITPEGMEKLYGKLGGPKAMALRGFIRASGKLFNRYGTTGSLSGCDPAYPSADHHSGGGLLLRRGYLQRLRAEWDPAADPGRLGGGPPLPGHSSSGLGLYSALWNPLCKRADR